MAKSLINPEPEENSLEFEQEQNLLEEIENFVNKLQLTTEEIILR
jgi:hypothetical protein